MIGVRSMIESLEKFMQNSLGIYFEKSDSDLMSIFYLNYMVVKLHQVYLQKFGRIPVKKNLHAVIANTNLTLNEEKIVFFWCDLFLKMRWYMFGTIKIHSPKFLKSLFAIRQYVNNWKNFL